MFKPREFGGTDMLTYRMPRSLDQAFPERPSSGLHLVYVRPTIASRLRPYWPLLAVIALVVAANVVYRLSA